MVEFDTYAKLFPVSELVAKAKWASAILWGRSTKLGWVTLPWSFLVVVPLEALNTTILSMPINVLALYRPDCAGFAVKVRLCGPDVKLPVKYCWVINYRVWSKPQLN
jgi:hypothetical protein